MIIKLTLYLFVFNILNLHVFSSERRKILQDNKVQHISSPENEEAIPLLAAWVFKAMVQTSFDSAINYAIAAITGNPGSLILDSVIDFGANLIPGAGEVQTGRKLTKISKAIYKVTKVFRNSLTKIPGGAALNKRLLMAIERLPSSKSLKEFKTNLSNSIGAIREAQIAGRLHHIENCEVIRLGKSAAKQSDWDMVFLYRGKKIGVEVKSARALAPSNKAARVFDPRGNGNFIESSLKELEKKAKQKIKSDPVDEYLYIGDIIGQDTKDMLLKLGIESVDSNYFLNNAEEILAKLF